MTIDELREALDEWVTGAMENGDHPDDQHATIRLPDLIELRKTVGQMADAIEAGHGFIFGASRVGDVGPYRTVQAAFTTLGYNVHPEQEA